MEQQVGFATTLIQQLQGRVRQPARKLLVMWAAATTRIIHFIKKSSGHTPLLAAMQPAFSYNFVISIDEALRCFSEYCFCKAPQCAP
jgi:hypothetical protein